MTTRKPGFAMPPPSRGHPGLAPCPVPLRLPAGAEAPSVRLPGPGTEIPAPADAFGPRPAPASGRPARNRGFRSSVPIFPGRSLRRSRALHQACRRHSLGQALRVRIRRLLQPPRPAFPSPRLVGPRRSRFGPWPGRLSAVAGRSSVPRRESCHGWRVAPSGFHLWKRRITGISQAHPRPGRDRRRGPYGGI